MGWGNCGHDSQGRPIGYYFEGTCDHPGCEEELDRGTDAACGGMHGEDEFHCEKYFCGSHLRWVSVACLHTYSRSDGAFVCPECADRWENEHYKECDDCRRGAGIVGQCEYCALKSKHSWIWTERGNGFDVHECRNCMYQEIFEDNLWEE